MFFFFFLLALAIVLNFCSLGLLQFLSVSEILLPDMENEEDHDHLAKKNEKSASSTSMSVSQQVL